MINFLLVGLGGFFGAIARYGLSALFLSIFEKPLSFFTILLINLIGCFSIGFLHGLEAGFLKPELRLLLVTGFLGGFTTYSAFAFESFEFLKMQDYLTAFFNIILHVAAGLLFVWLGNMLAKNF